MLPLMCYNIGTIKHKEVTGMAQNDIKQLCLFNNAKEAARILYEEEGYLGILHRV